jgi:hypothetical protein
MRPPRSYVGLALFFTSMIAVSAGCGASHDQILADINRKHVNEQIVGCNRGDASSCKQLGDDFLQKSSASRTSDWQQERNEATAKRAYHMACILGDGSSCAAIVEYGLATSPAETARYETRAAFFGTKIRDRETLRAAEDKARGEADDQDAKLAAIRADETARSNAQLQAIGGLVQQTGQQAQANIAAANHSASTPATPTPIATPTAAHASATPVAAPPAKPGEVKHCRNRLKESRGANNDLLCITTDVGHPCMKDNECDTVRCMLPGTAFLFDAGESGDGVCCSQAGRFCDKKHPCCPEAHCVPQYNIGAADEQGSCSSN